MSAPHTTTRTSAAATVTVAGRQLLIALRFLLVMTLALGVAYPLVVFGIGRIWASDADGSLVRDSAGAVVGSSLIGQQFDGPAWFHGRPSAAGEGYDAMSSGGSNLAADSEELVTQVEERRAAIQAENTGADGPGGRIPADGLTASGSGLDPDISPGYAALQIDRVAVARGVPADRVQDLVAAHTRGRLFGFIGQERVNVLELNLALDALAPAGG